VHPPPEQESILGQFLLGGLDLGRQLFLAKKCTSKQNPGYAYAHNSGLQHIRNRDHI